MKSGASAAKGKLDETGVTDGAMIAGGMVAVSAKAAGGYVYEKGATGLSFVNDKIEENPTLAGAKTKAAEGASQMAKGASQVAQGATQMASQAAGYMGSFFGWGGTGSSAKTSAAAEESVPDSQEETKDEKAEFAEPVPSRAQEVKRAPAEDPVEDGFLEPKMI